MEHWVAIILGGGKGLRMGADVPKQFLEVGGTPILMRTINRFREAFSSAEGMQQTEIILVLPKDQQEYWHELCQKHHFTEEYKIADGGKTRFHSIKNGLALIPDDAQGVVAVHDGVRPFPSVEVIVRCFETARKTGTAVPVVPVVETLRKIKTQQTLPPAPPYRTGNKNHLNKSNCSLPIGRAGGGSFTVPRSEYRLVQTPQAFDIQLHKQAYQQPYNDNFTDDASVVEAFLKDSSLITHTPPPMGGSWRGGAITLVEGNRENIKITTPFDLIVAEALVSSIEKKEGGTHV